MPVYVKLLGVNPSDLQHDASHDEAEELAATIHDLVREKFGALVDGVAVVVNQQHHERLQEASPAITGARRR